jgi:hypothetical protein
LFEVEEFGGSDTGFFPDFDQRRRFKEVARGIEGSPHGKMDDAVWIAIVFEDLIGPLSGIAADVRGVVENLFPRGVVRDFVNDQYVVHDLLFRMAIIPLPQSREIPGV